MNSLAIIGTNGLPSRYGGFETLVEYLVEILADKYEITVFCSAPSYKEKPLRYKGCTLEYIPLKANGWQSIPYDIVSLFKSCRKFHKVLILGCSGGIVMPFLFRYREKFIFNFGGLDWQRSKWNFFTRKFLKVSEALSIKYSGKLISDNRGIQDYILKEYNRDSVMIAYGGDQVFKVKPEIDDIVRYPFLSAPYAFTVARIQHDNNIDILLESFSVKTPFPLVFVGNWKSSTYGIKTKAKYSENPNIVMLDAIYDQRELNLLRSNCTVYLHGHSAGGTNPALVEAMNLELAVFAYDCIFNKYTTNFQAQYFSSPHELSKKLNNSTDAELSTMRINMYKIAEEMYIWKKIAYKYSEVIDL